MIEEAMRYFAESIDLSAETVYQDANTKLIRRGSEIITVELPDKPRNNEAADLQTIISLANRFHGDTPAVWYGIERVTAILRDGDDNDRDWVTLRLKHAPQYNLLRSLEKGDKWFEQKLLVRLLRIDLDGAHDPLELLEKVRGMKFESGSVTTGKVKRQDESLGRSISGSVTSDEGELPEEVTMNIAIYSNPGEDTRYPVVCAVETDALAAKIQLVPLPGELDRAVQLAMASIATRLGANLTEGIPVYHGTP